MLPDVAPTHTQKEQSTGFAVTQDHYLEHSVHGITRDTVHAPIHFIHSTHIQDPTLHTICYMLYKTQHWHATHKAGSTHVALEQYT